MILNKINSVHYDIVYKQTFDMSTSKTKLIVDYEYLRKVANIIARQCILHHVEYVLIEDTPCTCGKMSNARIITQLQRIQYFFAGFFSSFSNIHIVMIKPAAAKRTFGLCKGNYYANKRAVVHFISQFTAMDYSDHYCDCILNTLYYNYGK